MMRVSSRPIPFPYEPEETQRLLIQSVLLEGARARQAFEEWRSKIEFEDLPYKEFRWLGELGRVIGRLAPEWENVPRVKAMQKYCWSHGIHILSTAKPVLAELVKNDIAVIALKGGGHIANNPSAMHYRTINDIDLMIPTETIPLASEVFIKAGWRPVSGRLPGRYRAQTFDKKNNSRAEGPHNVEVDLHHRVVHFGRYGDFDLEMFERAKPGSLLGVPVLVPSPLDQALIAISQALTPGPGDTNVWIGDLVRAVKEPTFDPDVFFAEVQRRQIAPHAACVLSWLVEKFGISPEIIPSDKRSIFRPVFVRELIAIGADRSERSYLDVAAMALAEYLRSGAFFRTVDFETDLGVEMSPLKNPSESIRLKSGPKQSWEVRKERGNQLTVRLGLPRDLRESRDYDLWIGDRWERRLRVRNIRKNRLTYWTAIVEIDPSVDLKQIRLTDAL